MRPKSVTGEIRYYWELPTFYKKLGCTLHKTQDTALGTDYVKACGSAVTLNALFDGR